VTDLLAQLDERTAIARNALKGDAKRVQRLIGRLEADEAKAQDGQALREQGEVLKIQMHAVPRGADQVDLAFPWEPERRITVHLQRELSPAQNLERMFRRARGFQQGLRIIAERWSAAQERLEKVRALQQKLEELRALAQTPGTDPGPMWRQVKPWLDAVLALHLPVVAPPSSPPPEVRRIVKGGELPAGVQRYTSPLGAAVLAGRHAAANDALVTRFLRGRDWWFHVRDQTGAHVVLRQDGKIAPAEAELRACAVLAAHLSGVPKGERVEVTCAPGKHVRKVKGSATGSVYVSEERVLRVEVQAEVVDAFYARLPPK
jgi:predicted ribosome quality control (RQC) complex YloA/Tae2 family protein